MSGFADKRDSRMLLKKHLQNYPNNVLILGEQQSMLKSGARNAPIATPLLLHINRVSLEKEL
jgi:hypothetical protein